MFFYSVSFGGFVGLSSFLPIYFHDQYQLSAVNGGLFHRGLRLCRIVRAAVRRRARRPHRRDARLVGHLRGGRDALLAASAQGVLPAFGALAALVIVAMAALGMGNGAVFQLVPQRFGRDVGLMTGLVGMTGGVGGFYLAASLGYAKQFTGSYGLGFALFAVVALAAWAGIAAVRLRWRQDAAVLAAARA